jgi:predicted amino acid dehydrogenase
MSIVENQIGLTTGNSLTCAMGLEALLKCCKDKGMDISEAAFAIVGAGGNIANICSEIIGEKVPKIILISNVGKENKAVALAKKIYENSYLEILDFKQNRKNEIFGISKAIYNTNVLNKLIINKTNVQEAGDELYKSLKDELGDNVPIAVTSDLNNLVNANIILTASNSDEAIIYKEMLSNNPTIICDIAIPYDVDDEVKNNMQNVEVINGGLVQLPFNSDFYIPGIPLEKGMSFACIAETILMGLNEIFSNYSYGVINKNQVKKIFDIAKIHGFKLGGMKTI